MHPQPAGCTPATPADQTRYLLSEALRILAEKARTISGCAELRVLIELSHRQITTGEAVKISSRALATACNVARSNVQPALDALAARSYITMPQGNTREPATYRVTII